MAMRSPRQAALGLVVVLAGLPVYEFIQRRRQRVPGAEPSLVN